jgi:hypothetical protein
VGHVYAQTGVVTSLVDILQNFRDHSEMIVGACTVLINMCADDDKRKVCVTQVRRRTP